jgi:CHASE3 domain sensor protein
MAIKTSKGREAYYSNYKAQNKQAKNRKAKLERLLKKDPDNEQVREALANVKYRRKTPTNPFWTSSKRKTATILKEFCGYFDPKVLSSNAKVASDALHTHYSRRTSQKREDYSAQAKAMYSIAARAKIVALVK